MQKKQKIREGARERERERTSLFLIWGKWSKRVWQRQIELRGREKQPQQSTTSWFLFARKRKWKVSLNISARRAGNSRKRNELERQKCTKSKELHTYKVVYECWTCKHDFSCMTWWKLQNDIISTEQGAGESWFCLWHWFIRMIWIFTGINPDHTW